MNLTCNYYINESQNCSGCSATCGGGYRSKARECEFPQSVERLFDANNPCKGPLEVIEECSKQVQMTWGSGVSQEGVKVAITALLPLDTQSW